MTNNQILELNRSGRIVLRAMETEIGFRVYYYDGHLKLLPWSRQLFTTREECEVHISNLVQTRPYRFVGQFNINPDE